MRSQVDHLLTGRDRLARYRHGKWIKREWEICQPGIMGVCAHQGFRGDRVPVL